MTTSAATATTTEHDPRPTAATAPADERLAAAYDTLRARLLAARGPAGAWEGELSSSALATATAVCALRLLDRRRWAGLTAAGVRWLLEHQNRDGGWGDTIKSSSNISTTMLARAAISLAASETGPLKATGPAAAHEALRRAVDYLERACGGSGAAALAEAIRTRYGRDRTFSVPILTCCALAGLVDWREVPALPFELACASPLFYSRLRLPVVSYALPALIALGIARYRRRPPSNPITRAARALAIPRVLRRLEAIQPGSGGFLEATPLTSFIVMSLVDAGYARHALVARAADFLVRAARPDGSWPIDTNLATWVTTLSVAALAARGPLGARGDQDRADWDALRHTLLSQQYHQVHPYTSAAPGGWAWTPLPGGVPDADDTAGALLALRHLPAAEESDDAARAGLRWLLDLQNRDGGWPTFCRGWGHLPFDRSGADLTAHALRALHAWTGGTRNDPPPKLAQLSKRARRACERGLRFLRRAQRSDGAWAPLWFGNEFAPSQENLTYGTARVLRAYCDLGRVASAPARQSIRWLRDCQHRQGGWGGAPAAPPTIEETALATEALLESSRAPAAETAAEAARAAERGVEWLIARAAETPQLEASPIGFYFAKLWYYEVLYPLIFTVGALGRALRLRTGAAGSPGGGAVGGA